MKKNLFIVAATILLSSLFVSYGTVTNEMKDVNSCTYKLVTESHSYQLFDNNELHEKNFNLIKLAISNLHQYFIEYDIFPDMNNNIFLIDDDLKIIQGKMNYTVYTNNITGNNIGRSNFKISDNKITFSNPEIFLGQDGWKSIPYQDTISETTACNTLIQWENTYNHIILSIEQSVKSNSSNESVFYPQTTSLDSIIYTPTYKSGSSSGSVKSSSSKSSSSGGAVSVKGYYRKDGTYVRPHTRSAPKRKK
jgi:hypothetical protein